MSRLELFYFPFKAMGSPCEIQFYANDSNQAKLIANSVISEINRLENRYSRYRPKSILSEINRIATLGGQIRVDNETAQLLNYADTCFVQSDGLFDITSGVLRKVWRFDIPKVPEASQIQALLSYVGWDKVSWRPPTLSFLLPGCELDFGGIVKEYAADRSAALCMEMGVRHGAVNLGGDIKIIGPHPDGDPWRVGIRDPNREKTPVKVVELYAGGLASSGDYERCLVINGTRYGHVLNPKTGWPVRHFSSVTVAAEFCVIAGSASTIAMLKEENGLAWLETLGLRFFWIDKEENRGGSLAENF